MDYVILYCVFVLSLTVILRTYSQESKLMRNPIQFWQFLLTIFAMLISFGLYLNGITDRQSRLEVTSQGQQKQIDELKVTTSQINGTMGDIKEDMGDIKGDVKVILSRIAPTH